MIRLDNVSKTYRSGVVSVDALRGVTLSIERGEIVAIIGPSGSGKSTLLNIVGCLDSPTEGTYTLDGTATAGLADDALAAVRNKKIGFVFQDFNLLPRYNALKNVMMPLHYAGIPGDERKRRAEKSLEMVRLTPRARHLPSELSGGEKQRVAIARALVNEPSIILADEPTGNLDSATGAEIMRILTDLNRELKTTVVLITHDPEIARYAARAIEIRDGRIVKDGKP
ncbi:MAG: macrolide ABC transporter ATP-binding protein [Planctomycetes bacterium RBG_16_59_8]|nr:MAG: macrolide ABC transporter ATP-binding protein [Planctomycetes bacterium RBG_16_59_8]